MRVTCGDRVYRDDERDAYLIAYRNAGLGIRVARRFAFVREISLCEVPGGCGLCWDYAFA